MHSEQELAAAITKLNDALINHQWSRAAGALAEIRSGVDVLAARVATAETQRRDKFLAAALTGLVSAGRESPSFIVGRAAEIADAAMKAVK